MANDRLPREVVQRIASQVGCTTQAVYAAWRNGSLQEATPDAMRAVLRHVSLMDMEWVSVEMLPQFISATPEQLAAWRMDGALLPSESGLYYSKDLMFVRPHRFGVLPSVAGYAPVRPYVNTPTRVTGCTMDMLYRKLVERRKACPYWLGRHDGVRTGYVWLPDGYMPPTRWGKPLDTWRLTLSARPPLHAPDALPRNSDGTTDRIFIRGHTTNSFTAVYLCMVDDYALPVRSSGMYRAPYAWHDALYRAVCATGYACHKLPRIADETDRLQEWLHTDP